MPIINRSTDYAVRALCLMASDSTNRRFPVAEFVRVLGVPRPFMRSILQALHKAGVLVAHKGRTGGFQLARPAGRITVADVMRIFQGRISINKCKFKKRPCPRKRTCPLKKRIDLIEEMVAAGLDSITMRSLVR